MRMLMRIVFSVTIALSSVAELSSAGSSGSVVVVAQSEPRAVAISLTIPADFVSVPIRVTSEQKKTGVSYEETRAAIALISEKAAESGQFKVKFSVVELSQRSSYFGISSGSWSRPAASADVYLLVPLTEEHSDIFTAGAVAAKFVESLSLPGKMDCELGELQLAVENPEQYRAKLLEMIAQQIADTREAMGGFGPNIKVEGLESPVHVRQVNDKEVEVFLVYALTLSSAG